MARSWPASGAAPTASRWSGTPRRRSTPPATQFPQTWDELMALTDQIAKRWRHPLVHRHRVRRCHRLGDDRLDRRCHAAHDFPRELRQVGQGRAEVRLPRSQKAIEVRHRDLVQRRVRLRRPQSHHHHLLWRCPQADVRESAQVLAAPPGQLHHHLLPRRPEAGCGLRLLLPASDRSRRTASPSWALATSMPCSTTAPKSAL